MTALQSSHALVRDGSSSNMAYQASPTRSSSINSLSNASNANSANGSPRSVQSGGGASTVTSVSSMGGGVPQPSEEELNGRTYLEWLKSWDDTMVARWLTDNRCGSHANTFAVNDIRGNVLLDVDQQALKEMGVQSVGDRIKINVAVKKLRQACIASSATQALAMRRPLPSSLSASSLSPQSQANVPPSPTHSLVSPNGSNVGVVSQAQLVRRVTNGKSAHRVPPPLHLASSSVTDAKLPQAYQASSSGSRSGSANGQSGASTYLAPAYGGTRPSTSPRSGHPPAQPPPKGQPPAPPGMAHLVRPGTSPSNRLAAPTISTTAASPTSSVGWPHQSDGRGQYQNRSAISNNPLPTQYTHKKAGSSISSVSSVGSGGYSYGTSPQSQNSYLNRPATSGNAHQQQSTTSPVRDAFLPRNQATSTDGSYRPTTAPSTSGSLGSLSYKTSHGNLGLSPITEGGSTNPSPVNAEFGGQKNQMQGFSVGKGGFGRPTTSAGTVSVPAGQSVASASSLGSVLPLEDVLRKTVKFVGDDGTSKMVNVEGARDTQEIMARALRKFNKLREGLVPKNMIDKARNDFGEVYAELDGWGAFITSTEGTKAVTEPELLAICTSPVHPQRSRGLLLRKLHITHTPASPEEARTMKARKLRNFFGEDIAKTAMSPTSPTHMLDVNVPTTHIEPSSPTPSSPSTNSDVYDPGSSAPTLPLKPTQSRKQMNRASTVSIMSGLNWNNGQGGGLPAISAAAARSPSVGILSTGQQKLRNFFGQRPPSELISNHLVDYFPTAPSEKKILSKTVRNTVRKSMMRRESSYAGSVYGGGQGKTSWDASRDSQSLSGLGLSRFSMSSAGSGSNGRASMDTIPPLPSKDSRFSDEYDSAPTSRPPLTHQTSGLSVTPSISFASEDGDSQTNDEDDAHSVSSRMTRRTTRPSSRLSAWSHSKSNKDSDNASLLTVEEVTEEVEKRISRASWASDSQADLARLADISGETGSDVEGTVAALDSSNDSYHGQDDTIDEEEEEEDATEEEEEEEDDEDSKDIDLDVPQTVTTTTKKSTFRWVKGALIGSGSFGQVYLGMNATNGSFMAVKQVELPTGNSHNEERKKSMLSALEREIELLKVIQHENIVQYLDSSSDGKNLYIFLEYVPGGSVAHLLSNYGTFEEALIRTFVKQILQGLTYLHDNDIIHRDIKGANILVDNRGGIKISDFGISKKVEENLLTSGSRMHRPSLQGSVFWMAPEVVKQTSYTAKADIWSLGCLIVEMNTGSHPWMELTQMQAIFKIGSAADARPTIPPEFSVEGRAFLDLTFKMDYKLRPTASELLKHKFITEDWDESMAPGSKA